ncbi:STAS domain-containing protein [Actinosynnema sp. NPDC023587]|uniref:STAS domain-containing protein n=1 Tax=Actinosynnema sp. NPDC023587 TaxID=3154695 RepID=UPI003400E88F
MTDHLTVTTRPITGGTVLEFAGRLDAVTSPGALRTIGGLALHRGQRLVLDLTRLDFCDSSGISVLITARSTALAAEAALALVAVPRGLRGMLARTGLDAVFPIYPTLARLEESWVPRP